MAAITPPNPNPSLSTNPTPFHPRTTFLHRFTLPISSNPKKRHPFLSISNVISNPKPTTTTTNTPPSPEPFVSRYAPDQPRKGSDVLVEALEREGVTDVFAYPVGASMDIHRSLTRSRIIRNFLPRHEQGVDSLRRPGAGLADLMEEHVKRIEGVESEIWIGMKLRSPLI